MNLGVKLELSILFVQAAVKMSGSQNFSKVTVQLSLYAPQRGTSKSDDSIPKELKENNTDMQSILQSPLIMQQLMHQTNIIPCQKDAIQQQGKKF